MAYCPNPACGGPTQRATRAYFDYVYRHGQTYAVRVPALSAEWCTVCGGLAADPQSVAVLDASLQLAAP